VLAGACSRYLDCSISDFESLDAGSRYAFVYWLNNSSAALRGGYFGWFTNVLGVVSIAMCPW
jgi:hypothetical protein